MEQFECLCRPETVIKQLGNELYYATDGVHFKPIQFRFTENYVIFTDGLLPIECEHGCGYMDTGGNIAIPMIYDEVYGFKDGTAQVCRNGRACFVDHYNHPVTPWYEDIMKCNGRYAVKNLGKWGLVDQDFQTLIKPQYEGCSAHTSELFGFCQNGRWGCVNLHGDIVIPFIFDYTYPSCSKNGEMFIVAKSQGKVSLYDTSGHCLIEPFFERILLIDDNHILLARNGKRDLLSFETVLASGKTPEAITLRFEDVHNSYNEDKLGVCTDGKWGYIDTAGRFVIESQFEDADCFENGIAQIKQNGKWALIQEDGTLLSPFYEWIDLYDDLAVVGLDDKQGIFDLTTKALIPQEFDDVELLDDDSVIRVYRDGMPSYIDHQGHPIIPDLTDFATVETDSGIGLMNERGEYILPTLFDSINILSRDNIACICKNGRFDYVKLYDPRQCDA